MLNSWEWAWGLCYMYMYIYIIFKILRLIIITHYCCCMQSLQESLCQSYVERAISLLKRQNEVIAHHPNSHVYSQLQSLVDFEGFYLESEPCLVCNDPEVPYTVSPLVVVVVYCTIQGRVKNMY